MQLSLVRKMSFPRMIRHQISGWIKLLASRKLMIPNADFHLVYSKDYKEPIQSDTLDLCKVHVTYIQGFYLDFKINTCNIAIGAARSLDILGWTLHTAGYWHVIDWLISSSTDQSVCRCSWWWLIAPYWSQLSAVVLCEKHPPHPTHTRTHTLSKHQASLIAGSLSLKFVH